MSTKQLHIISITSSTCTKEVDLYIQLYTSIYIDHSLYVLWFWKKKSFFTFSRLCVVLLIHIYHRTSSIPSVYKANMFTISFNSETIILLVSVTFSVYLNKNHGRLFKKFTDVCVLKLISTPVVRPIDKLEWNWYKKREML